MNAIYNKTAIIIINNESFELLCAMHCRGGGQRAAAGTGEEYRNNIWNGDYEHVWALANNRLKR